MDRPLTLVLGASPAPWRYAHMAVARLVGTGHRVLAVGRRTGDAGGVPIQADLPLGVEVDTVTFYLNGTNQGPWVERVLALKPRRIILNPGAENAALAERARNAGIEVVNGCTLVMLAAGTY